MQSEREKNYAIVVTVWTDIYERYENLTKTLLSVFGIQKVRVIFYLN